MPVLLAKMACVLMSRRSGRRVLGSGYGPSQPSSPALWPQHLTLDNVQDQAGVLVGMEEDHVTQGAVSERWAQHRDVVLGDSKTRATGAQSPVGAGWSPPQWHPLLCLILGRVLKLSGPQFPQL